MRKIKRLFLIVSTLLFAISLASCDSTKRNTQTPMGDINASTIVATAGEYKLTADVFYSQLRNQGYSTVLNKIKSNLFAAEITEVKNSFNFSDSEVNDYERQLFDSFASAIYGSTDLETIKDLTEDELNEKINKCIDTFNNEGITLTKEDCLKYTEIDEEIAFTAVPDAVVNKYILTIATKKAAKDKLATIVDSEKIEDSEGELITNTNYIDEEDIESYYEKNQKTYGTFNAIIIQFNTLTEARKAIAATEAQVGALTKENALNFYINLYNNYYNYRVEIDSTTPFKDYGNAKTRTIFKVNADENDLNEISSSIQSIVTTTLENDFDYLERPFNQSNKYIMVYRGETTYDINDKYSITETDDEGQVTWETLKANAKAYEEISKEIKDELIDQKVSSYTTTITNDRIEAAEIKIFDPLFETKFKSSYDNYELIDTKAFNNSNIYELVYNNNTYTYSVADFYAEQALSSGVKTIYNLLSNEYAYGYKDLFLDEEAIEAIEDEVEASIKTFNKDENTAYPKAIGLETFLVANYGYTTEELVIKSKVAQSALSKYLSDALFDEWATADHKVAYDKLNALDNILAAGNKKYNDIFSINIDHMLIFLDDNGDGNPDDPKEFTKYFSAEEKTAYENALVALAQAIYAETQVEELTKSNDLMEILNYIVEAYTKNEALYSDPTKTWADYKKYNFLLKVESLSSSGDTTQSNVGNYVVEFGDYVKELYDVVVENEIKIEDEEPKFIFTTSKDSAPSTFADLCATQFGYHMIVVNDYEERGTTESKKDDDTNGYQANIEVLIDEKEKDNTEDNIYVVVEDTYNEDSKTAANIKQLFVYYVQKQTGATSTLDSDVEDVMKSMFGDAISRYLSTSFQNYLLYNELAVKVEYAPLATYYANYKGYLARTSQNYDAEDDFADWYSDSINWARPYAK